MGSRKFGAWLPGNACTASLMALAFAVTALPATAQNCGWSRVDHRVSYDASGAWNPNVYRGLVGAADARARSAARCGKAPRRASARRCGRASIRRSSPACPRRPASTSSRERVLPTGTIRACGSRADRNYSFPSGEASVAAALVTPYVLEYGSDYPATYALAAAAALRRRRVGSRTRRTGRPTCWPAGRSAASPAGTRTAATFRS